MKIATPDELQANLTTMLDSVTDDHEPVVISREEGKPAAVLIALEDLGSYEETHHLLRSPRNAERLLRAIAKLEAGGGVERELIDPDA